MANHPEAANIVGFQPKGERTMAWELSLAGWKKILDPIRNHSHLNGDVDCGRVVEEAGLLPGSQLRWLRRGFNDCGECLGDPAQPGPEERAERSIPPTSLIFHFRAPFISFT